MLVNENWNLRPHSTLKIPTSGMTYKGWIPPPPLEEWKHTSRFLPFLYYYCLIAQWLEYKTVQTLTIHVFFPQDAVRNILRVLECTNCTDIPVYRGAREALGNAHHCTRGKRGDYDFGYLGRGRTGPTYYIGCAVFA
jgi:hypothetical protein